MRSASTSRLVFILTALELQVFSEQTRSVIAVVCFCESPIQLLAVPIVRITVPICEFVVAHAYDPRLSVLFRDLARGVRRCLSIVFAGERVSLSQTCTTSLILSVCGGQVALTHFLCRTFVDNDPLFVDVMQECFFSSGLFTATSHSTAATCCSLACHQIDMVFASLLVVFQTFPRCVQTCPRCSVGL